MSKWIGYAVSVNCGEPLGCYQGTILAADGTTITLTKAFRNGFPYPKSQVTLNAADIKELKIIEARAEPAPAGQTHSTVAVSKAGKKAARATVCENLQANPSSSGNQACQQGGAGVGKSGTARGAGGGGGGGVGPTRSKPIDIQGPRSGKGANHAGSHGPTGSTPKSRGCGGGCAGGGGQEKARRRNEACFGDAADPSLDTDFDFEGNLALFDKRALWEQMNNQKPDLVRQADEAGKYRHDENVLSGGECGAGAGAGAGGGARRRGCEVPAELRAWRRGYVSDEGVCVPALTAAARRRLWAAVRRAGLAPAAQVLLARAAADVCIRLVGGCRRLEARNAHQAPVVVVVADGRRAGAAALTAARLLRSHGATVHCYLPATHERGARMSSNSSSAEALRSELSALALSEVPVATRLDQLPLSPDLVLMALRPPAPAPAPSALPAPSAYGPGDDPAHPEYNACVAWVRGARAAVVALEPPEQGVGVACRAAVVGLLPPALPPHAGRVYLADTAPPPRLFAELGIVYRPPFGAASTLALHPAEPDV